jgi:Uma2 family endonuclease
MPRVADVGPITIEKYLEIESASTVRHEFVDGYMFAMAGSKDNHNTIVINITTRIRQAVRGTLCRVFAENIKVQTPTGKFYYPDVFVTCQEPNDGSTVKQFPCFIVEVLSDSTADIDRDEKFHNYRKISSLQAYILVSQKYKVVEVFRYLEDKTWRYEVLEDEGKLELPCINTSITLDEIYEDVDFSKQENVSFTV